MRLALAGLLPLVVGLLYSQARAEAVSPYSLDWENTIAICAIMRLERIEDIREWLQYHRCVLVLSPLTRTSEHVPAKRLELCVCILVVCLIVSASALLLVAAALSVTLRLRCCSETSMAACFKVDCSAHGSIDYPN
jgi:hypothetical protein